MSEDTARIRLRIGRASIECEGRESFLKDDLPHVVETLSGLLEKHDRARSPAPGSPAKAETGSPTETVGKSQIPQLSMTAVASRMEVKTGSELARAAYAYLAFVKKRETFSRSDILSAMQEAKEFYKQSHKTNLTRSLNGFVKSGYINDFEKDTFALNKKEKDELEKRISQFT